MPQAMAWVAEQWRNGGVTNSDQSAKTGKWHTSVDCVQVEANGWNRPHVFILDGTRLTSTATATCKNAKQPGDLTRNCHIQHMRSFFPSRGHKIGRGRNWEEAPAAALPQKRSSMTKGCPFCLPLESTKFALWLEQIDIAVIGTGPSRGCQHCCGAPHTLSRLWAAGSWCLMPRFCGVPARLGCWNNPCWPAETVEKMEKNWQRNYINSILQQSCNISKWM